MKEIVEVDGWKISTKTGDIFHEHSSASVPSFMYSVMDTPKGNKLIIDEGAWCPFCREMVTKKVLIISKLIRL